MGFLDDLAKFAKDIEKSLKPEEILKLKSCKNCYFYTKGFCRQTSPPTKILSVYYAQGCIYFSTEQVTTGIITATERSSASSLLDRVKLIDLITEITTVDTITTIATLQAITNIVNIESLDLIDSITEIANISSLDLIDLITEISNISSIDLLDRITLIDTITEIANISSIDLIDVVTNSTERPTYETEQGNDIDVNGIAVCVSGVDNLTLLYTVPAGKTLYIYDWSIGINSADGQVYGSLEDSVIGIRSVGGGIRGFQTPFSKPKKVLASRGVYIRARQDTGVNQNVRFHFGGFVI